MTLKLVEKAEELETSLEEVSTIKMYEVIYFLYTYNSSLKKEFRFLYKFHYYLTKKEKEDNPSWGDFIAQMDELYKSQIETF
ncbi:hypothetical protein [Sinobaca sp. H24]|uniref:hypothetical protein n=1 Tax=Sinobaca sp. H24 TaxID=2923376 RepID=UPI00207B0338|nr:hypothetical protein [Sinobaca sp. H24]